MKCIDNLFTVQIIVRNAISVLIVPRRKKSTSMPRKMTQRYSTMVCSSSLYSLRTTDEDKPAVSTLLCVLDFHCGFITAWASL